MLSKYRGDPKGFYRLVYDYKNGKLTKFRKAEQIVKKLSSIDAFKGARDTIRFATVAGAGSTAALPQMVWLWMINSPKSFLNSKKRAAISAAGRLMYKEGTSYYTQLLELSNQTKLIVAEMQLGKLAKLRSLISVGKEDKRVEFIGGLQKLNINETLEYWPFEGEYWEDELGFYVYNLESMCKKIQELNFYAFHSCSHRSIPTRNGCCSDNLQAQEQKRTQLEVKERKRKKRTEKVKGPRGIDLSCFQSR